MTGSGAAFTLETFAPLMGSAFAVGGAGTGVELLLDAMDSGPEQPGAPRIQPFSLTFTGPSHVALPQGIYPLQHLELGTIELFLVPRQPLQDGLSRYEAVFN